MYARKSSASVVALTFASVLILLPACAAGPTGPRFQGATAPEDLRIAVEVHNIGWADVTIYSVSAGSRIRLGTVPSNTSQRFRLPRVHEWSPDLRLMADPIGSPQGYLSEPISPATGQVIRWTVHETRSFRSMMVW